MPVINYGSLTGRRLGLAGRVSAGLLCLQLLWFYPAVFGVWVLLCSNQLIRDPVANLAGAAAVVAPSLLAAPLALRDVLSARRTGRGRFGPAIAPLTFAAAFILFVFAATVYEWLYPEPYPCL